MSKILERRRRGDRVCCMWVLRQLSLDNGRQYRRDSMAMDEKAVRQELVYNLEEWGLTNSDDKRHRTYRHHILNEVIAQFHEKNTSATFEHLKSEVFPKDYSEAIRFFFRHDLQESRNRLVYSSVDRLEEVDDFKAKPYYRRYDKRDKSKVFGYGITDRFRKVTKADLDPIDRFLWVFEKKGSEAERIFRDWFLCEESAMLEGKVFEAVLACHAIYKEACFHCKRRNSLRWNGGPDTSWMDLVCITCNSTFEVKTKASMERCETELERNLISGGSYYNFWRHRNAIRDNKNQKMFLVVLPRPWTMNRSGRLVRPVSCFEIEYILPVVRSSCFRPIKPPPGITKEQKERYKILPLRSLVKLKTAPVEKAHWFSLEWEPPIEWGLIMEQVFIEHYSKKEFDRLEAMYFVDSSSSEGGDNNGGEKHEQKQTEADVEPENTVERLKAELEKMKLCSDADEDWETMF